MKRPRVRRAVFVAVMVQAALLVTASQPALAVTTIFTPVADATVRSDQPGTNLGSNGRLVADLSPATQAFLRFEVYGPETPVTDAKLRLWVTDSSSSAPEVWPLTADWEEATVTWSTRPPGLDAAIADHGSVRAGQWVEYDVSGFVTGLGVYNMALVADRTDGTDFASREDPDAARRPQLVIETEGGEEEPPPPTGSGYSFGLVGDTGYSSGGVARFLASREEMNDAGLAFSVHVGDFKSGDVSCSDSVYAENRDRFDGFDHPLAYTPGDNEWRNCSSKGERLDHLRSQLFDGDQTRGTPSMTVERQSAAYPENTRWHRGPVTFVTLHTVGPDNNAGSSEFAARNTANLTWLGAAFDAARARNSAGIVILSHANPGFTPDATSRAKKAGFEPLMQLLRSEVKAWGRPVLYVHGDTHTFRVDHPKILGSTRPNLTRVEVFGPSHERWVKVDVDPSDPDVFRVSSR